MVQILLELVLANPGHLLLAHDVPSNVPLNGSCVHVLVRPDQVQNICLVIFAPPRSLELCNSSYSILDQELILVFVQEASDSFLNLYRG